MKPIRISDQLDTVITGLVTALHERVAALHLPATDEAIADLLCSSPRDPHLAWIVGRLAGIADVLGIDNAGKLAHPERVVQPGGRPRALREVPRELAIQMLDRVYEARFPADEDANVNGGDLVDNVGRVFFDEGLGPEME